MKHFKNSIFVACIIVCMMILQSILISSQNTPEFILNLGKSLFYFEKLIGAAILAFAIVTDLKNYILSRY
ncbi:hypothetical protein [Paraclostridium dentum]|uniref:hypothetical protein n=1 Tax=Paraclostridium dentum TaxID=2662455 RepID=UPI00147433A7|nr:hypothetical protein [Paraclostridium dentum]